MRITIKGVEAELDSTGMWRSSDHHLASFLNNFTLGFVHKPYYPGGPDIELVDALVTKYKAVALDRPELEAEPDVVY